MPALPGKQREVDPIELARWLEALANADRMIRLAVVEQVHAMPEQGVRSTFTFGCGYGMVRGVLAARSIPTELVTPQAWKRLVLAGYTDKNKEAAIQYATRRFPNASLRATPRSRTSHDGLADALCLAEYARRQIIGATALSACPA